MRKRDKLFTLIKILLVLFFLGVLLVGQAEVFIAEIFITTYVVVFIIVVIRTLMTPGRRKTRRYLTLAYSSILAVQLIMLNNVIYSETTELHEFIIRRLFGLVLLFLPMLVNRYVASVKYTHYYIPPMGETAAVGISELMNTASEIKRTAGVINNSRKKLSIENLKFLALDMTRHDSFHYVNSRSLTEEYFIKARESFSDPNIYIVISKTGSPASEFISVFTQKQYNHASISFDSKLYTTISYNGGERVYPPGLNMELLEFFCKAPDSKIMVYSLPCTAEQKKQMLDKIAKINKEGSAYNMLGVFFNKKPHRPNILYCSQFVYSLLQDAGLAYFEAGNEKLSPTDLVELDYYRKLKFELEITFG